MTERKPLTVTLDWRSMFYMCMDVYCTCGEQFHVDVHSKEKLTAEYLRCPHCERVYHCGDTVALQREKIDYGKSRPRPHASAQWKGTELHGIAKCDCGHEDAICRDFAYEHDCTACGAHFHVHPDINLTELSAQEVAKLPEGTHIATDNHPETEDEAFEPVWREVAPDPELQHGTLVMPGRVPEGARIVIVPDIHIAMGREAIARQRKLLDQALRSGTLIMLGGDVVR